MTNPDLPFLRHLYLEEIFLPLPTWITEFTNLETLDLYEVGDIEAVISNLSKLEKLINFRMAYVENSKCFPAYIWQLSHIKQLNIDGAELEYLPLEITSFCNLESFSWEFCSDLEQIFDVLKMFKNLKRLHLTHDSLHDVLPETFKKLLSLDELDLHDWPALDSLPEYIGTMRNLRSIDISNPDIVIDTRANIVELPESICDLPNLENINLYGLQDFKEFPKNFFKLTTLKSLNIIDSGIETLELSQIQYRNLEKLRMQGPFPDFKQCANLKKLAVVINDSNVDGLENIPSLEDLAIYGCKLNSTQFLVSFKNLRKLYLSCDFELLPEDIDKLKKLEYISISNAHSLKRLPDALNNIDALKEVHLSWCGEKRIDNISKKVTIYN